MLKSEEQGIRKQRRKGMVAGNNLQISTMKRKRRNSITIAILQRRHTFLYSEDSEISHDDDRYSKHAILGFKNRAISSSVLFDLIASSTSRSTQNIIGAERKTANTSGSIQTIDQLNIIGAENVQFSPDMDIGIGIAGKTVEHQRRLQNINDINIIGGKDLQIGPTLRVFVKKVRGSGSRKKIDKSNKIETVTQVVRPSESIRKNDERNLIGAVTKAMYTSGSIQNIDKSNTIGAVTKVVETLETIQNIDESNTTRAVTQAVGTSGSIQKTDEMNIIEALTQAAGTSGSTQKIDESNTTRAVIKVVGTSGSIQKIDESNISIERAVSQAVNDSRTIQCIEKVTVIEGENIQIGPKIYVIMPTEETEQKYTGKNFSEL